MVSSQESVAHCRPIVGVAGPGAVVASCHGGIGSSAPVDSKAMTAQVPAEMGGALRLAVLRLSRRLRQVASPGGVTLSQMSAMTVVARHGEVTLGELAALERVAPPSMTRIAARLEENGWLERRSDPGDRRVTRVALSQSGMELVEGNRRRGDAFISARMAGLSQDEIEILGRAIPILERIASQDLTSADAQSASSSKSVPSPKNSL